MSTPASSLALSSCMASLIRIPYKNFFRVGTLLTQICMKYVSKLLAGMCVWDDALQEIILSISFMLCSVAPQSVAGRSRSRPKIFLRETCKNLKSMKTELLKFRGIGFLMWVFHYKNDNLTNGLVIVLVTYGWDMWYIFMYVI